MNLFKEKVINGNFQRFGRMATRATPDLETGDFCFIFFPSRQDYKYGIVIKKLNDHRVEMHPLVQDSLGIKFSLARTLLSFTMSESATQEKQIKFVLVYFL